MIVLFDVNTHVYSFLVSIFCVNLCVCFFLNVLFCILPMLILIGSFSLLAASTSCRRTSITPSLCLLVSMASHSDCAAGDLMGRRIKKDRVRSNTVYSNIAAEAVLFPAVPSKNTTVAVLAVLLRACGPLNVNTWT